MPRAVDASASSWNGDMLRGERSKEARSGDLMQVSEAMAGSIGWFASLTLYTMFNFEVILSQYLRNIIMSLVSRDYKIKVLLSISVFTCG